MATLYDFLYILSSPVLFTYLGYRYAFRRKYHESLAGMLGRRMPQRPDRQSDDNRPLVFWVH